MKKQNMVLLGALLAGLTLSACATARPVVPAEPAAKAGAEDADVRGAVLGEAEKHVGKPYKSPPDAPNSFDCSGYASYVFEQAAHIDVPKATAAYAAGVGEEIDFKDAKPGDILVFVSVKGGSKLDHVAILYKKSDTGELRGSRLIHAISVAGGAAVLKGNPTGVVIYEMGKRGDGKWQNEYFLSRYLATKRFIDD
jgi:cell wall-associated NlpC family hydrolase